MTRWRLLITNMLLDLVLLVPDTVGQQVACGQQDLAGRMNAIGMYCDAFQATCGAACAGVLLSTFDECGLDSATQARWQGARDACAAVVGGGHESTQEQQWLRGDCRADGRYACRNGGTCVLQSQRHARRAQQGSAAGLCPPSHLAGRTETVNAACCTPAVDCSGGMPATCSAQCAQVLVPFVAECADALSETALNWKSTMLPLLQRAVDKCAPPAPPPAPPAPSLPLGPAFHACSCAAGYTGRLCEEPSGKG